MVLTRFVVVQPKSQYKDCDFVANNQSFMYQYSRMCTLMRLKIVSGQSGGSHGRRGGSLEASDTLCIISEGFHCHLANLQVNQEKSNDVEKRVKSRA